MIDTMSYISVLYVTISVAEGLISYYLFILPEDVYTIDRVRFRSVLVLCDIAIASN